MPYELVKRKGLWWVVGPNGTMNKQGYDSREKALAYQRALYAHSKDKK